MKNLWLFNKNRLEILRILAGCQSAGGCDLRRALSMDKNLLSYHLNVLKKKGFVEDNKQGREKLFRLKKDKVSYVKKVFSIV
jgi:DNA-binding transcriptional ArsR family regulator